MKLTDIKEFFKHQENYYFLYIIFLVSYVAYYLVQWPIFAGDSDLWYHLNGGRYILEHGTIPKDSSFFSFITPPREYVDYYWLFQVLVYKIYTFSGYGGLILLRAAVFLALAVFVYCYLTQKKSYSKPSLYIALLFSFYLITLITRYHLVRPHIFSYFFIIVFLYVLEFKREKIIFLPLAAVLWTNLHGIEYPVMLLLVLAYLLEYAFNYVKSKSSFKGKEVVVPISLIICIAAVYMTPLGAKLTWIPFVPTGFTSLYIDELKHFEFNDLSSYSIVNMLLSPSTVFNLLLMFGCFCFIASFFRKDIRISHIILFVGGLILLTKARRFTIEFLLLSIPALTTYISAVSKSNFSISGFKPNVKAVFVLSTAFILFIPFYAISKSFGIMPRYPFSHRGLPYGNAVFLNKVGVGGKILNNPNNGGYFQWALHPKYKIYMDMQVPFLFSDEDIYFLAKSLSRKNLFHSMIERYKPGFISVSLKNRYFKDLIKSFSQYKLVFFDEIEALYADENQYPEVVKKYNIKYVDPFTIVSIDIDKLLEKKAHMDEELAELSKMLDIYPECGFKNQIFAIVFNKKSEYEKAIYFAERLINSFPDAHSGYKLKADALNGMAKYDKAIEEYKKALKRTDDKLEIYREIGNVYLKQKNYAKAYKMLKGINDPFLNNTDYKSMYNLCLSALMSGNLKDAEITFRYAYVLVPPEDKDWNEKYAKLEEMIKKGEKAEAK